MITFFFFFCRRVGPSARGVGRYEQHTNTVLTLGQVDHPHTGWGGDHLPLLCHGYRLLWSHLMPPFFFLFLLAGKRIIKGSTVCPPACCPTSASAYNFPIYRLYYTFFSFSPIFLKQIVTTTLHHPPAPRMYPWPLQTL
jgi:hypothetical protein